MHGMSYAVSGNVKSFKMKGYPQEEPLIPHGVSVILNAPAVVKFTSTANRERHLLAAEALGADIRGASTAEDAAEILQNEIIKYMKATDMPNGLKAVGYDEKDIDILVDGTFPQKRVVENCPVDVTKADLSKIFKNAMKYW